MKLLTKAMVALSVILMLSGCEDDGPGKAVKGMYQALDAGNINEAYAYLSKDAQAMMNQTGGKENFVLQAQMIKSKNGLKSIKIKNTDVTGDIASVASRVNFNDGTKFDQKNTLIREDGTWKFKGVK